MGALAFGVAQPSVHGKSFNDYVGHPHLGMSEKNLAHLMSLPFISYLARPHMEVLRQVLVLIVVLIT